MQPGAAQNARTESRLGERDEPRHIDKSMPVSVPFRSLSAGRGVADVD